MRNGFALSFILGNVTYETSLALPSFRQYLDSSDGSAFDASLFNIFCIENFNVQKFERKSSTIYMANTSFHVFSFFSLT
jgi:hypothetical protein